VSEETMKAIVQEEYGAAPEDVLRLAEVPTPTIGDREVLVRVRAASVDRGTLARAGRPAVPDPLIDAGKVSPVIDRTYPLSEAAAAVRYLLDGSARGKVVVVVEEPPAPTP
jgi:NADPH:quinone reductase-like Zn-dependent oxidoreductase